MKIHIGCGAYKKEGYVNVDWQSLVTPDVLHNLNVFPYPFEDNVADLIEIYHVLEHLDRPFEVMREMHRILKPGGVLHVKVPHFSRGFSHPEHAHGFDITFPLYFQKTFTPSGYLGFEYILVSRRLQWLAFFHLMPYMGYGRMLIGLLRGVNAVVSAFANLAQGFASRIWCFWVGGFDEIEFVFTAKK